MKEYERYMHQRFVILSGMPKFSKNATNLLSRYICLMFAASDPPINLDIGVSVLYNNIEHAKENHKIKRQTFDIFVQYFQRDFDLLCDKDFNPRNRSEREENIETMVTRALGFLHNYAPTIIEPIYKTTV